MSDKVTQALRTQEVTHNLKKLRQQSLASTSLERAIIHKLRKLPTVMKTSRKIFCGLARHKFNFLEVLPRYTWRGPVIRLSALYILYISLDRQLNSFLRTSSLC